MYSKLTETVKVSPVVLYFLYFTALSASLEGALTQAVDYHEEWLKILSS